MFIRVETYSGYAADERPHRFETEGGLTEVVEIVDRWRTPTESGFRVRADDGRSYILRQRSVASEETEWDAELVR